MTIPVEIRHSHVFCGMGGGKRGFNKGKARVGKLRARPRCIGGIDVDPEAIRKFNAMGPGRPGVVIDLFSLEQYIAFHGRRPPPGWCEATPADVRRAFGNERPHVGFLSAPCKGFSGLLAEARAATAKYQALNELTLRGIWLFLEAYKDDPVPVILFENVPRIATRGRHLLDQIVGLLRAYGYAVAETKHDCGELGGLAQSRKRFLLIARHTDQVPAFIYEPVKRPLRAVGEVLSKFPLPGHPVGGPMHRMPSLQWKTWVRLAFVQAGSDWRSLKRLAVEDGYLKDFCLVPEWHRGVLGVSRWTEPTGVVTSGSRPQNGNFSVADPLVRGHEKSVQLGVRRWDQIAGVVTAKMFAGGGPNSVADPRIDTGQRFNNVYRVVRWTEASPAVTAGAASNSNAAMSVADPRPGYGDSTHHNVIHVNGWDGRAKTITAGASPSAGAQAVADPRMQSAAGAHENKMRVTGWDEHARVVTGSDRVGSGALSVADPRNSRFGVIGWHQAAGVVQGESHPSNGAFSVADPRPEWNRHSNNLKVVGFGDTAPVVIGGGKGVQGGYISVADPRPACVKGAGDDYMTGGHYGVVPWDKHSNVVSGNASHDNGFNNVADPRLPEPNERLVALIVAEDGTWHRPFTTLELAGLQSLIDPDERWPTDPKIAREIEAFERSLWLPQGAYSDAAWREHIGNAVPPDAAESMAGVIYRTLLAVVAGESLKLSKVPVWVRDVAIALSVRPA